VDRKPAYVPPTTPAHNFVPADGKKIYTGGCHCGAAKFALLSEPLEQATHARVESEVCDCNCSLCSGVRARSQSRLSAKLSRAPCTERCALDLPGTQRHRVLAHAAR
jgi:hypothetical protein